MSETPQDFQPDLSVLFSDLPDVLQRKSSIARMPRRDRWEDISHTITLSILVMLGTHAISRESNQGDSEITQDALPVVVPLHQAPLPLPFSLADARAIADVDGAPENPFGEDEARLKTLLEIDSTDPAFDRSLLDAMLAIEIRCGIVAQGSFPISSPSSSVPSMTAAVHLLMEAQDRIGDSQMKHAAGKCIQNVLGHADTSFLGNELRRKPTLECQRTSAGSWEVRESSDQSWMSFDEYLRKLSK